MLTYLIKLEHCFGSRTSAHQNDTASIPKYPQNTIHKALVSHHTCCHLTQLNGCPNFRWKDCWHTRAIQTAGPAVAAAGEPCMGSSSSLVWPHACKQSIIHSPSCGLCVSFKQKYFLRGIFSAAIWNYSPLYPENSLGKRGLPPLSLDNFYLSTFVKILSH